MVKIQYAYRTELSSSLNENVGQPLNIFTLT